MYQTFQISSSSFEMGKGDNRKINLKWSNTNTLIKKSGD